MPLSAEIAQQSQLGANDQTKKRAVELLRAYHKSYSPYSELIQNSIDAIHRRYKLLSGDPAFDDYRNQYGLLCDAAVAQQFVGKLSIILDLGKRTICLRDNGVGIPHDRMLSFLLPDVGDKKVGRDYGFKGYGLTFAAFASRELRITSRHIASPDTYEIRYDGLYDWAIDDTNVLPIPAGPCPDPVVAPVPLDGTSVNTEIEIRLDSNYSQRGKVGFALDSTLDFASKNDPTHIERLIYVLRSRTAIGNTRGLYGLSDPFPVHVNLEITFADGSSHSTSVPYEYWHPTSHHLLQPYTMDFGAVVTTPPACRTKYRAITHHAGSAMVGTHSQLKCHFHITAVATTQLTGVSDALLLDEIPNKDLHITSGVFLAIGGVPTGIRIDLWETAGNDRKRFFAVVDVDKAASTHLDPGRVAISRHFANLISDKVWSLITTPSPPDTTASFLQYATSYLDVGRSSGAVTGTSFAPRVASAQAAHASYAAQQAMHSVKIRRYSPFIGPPQDEQDVVGMFCSLLQGKALKGYEVLFLSSKAEYDAALQYKISAVPANTEPTDPVGIGRQFAKAVQQNLGGTWDHSLHYRGRTDFPEIWCEFKTNLGQLLIDLIGDRTYKQLKEIDLVVAWDSTIPPSVDRATYALRPVVDRMREYHGQTHWLNVIIPGQQAKDLPVILLSDVLMALP